MSDNSCPASANHHHCYHIEYADVSGKRMTDMERCCFCGLQRQHGMVQPRGCGGYGAMG
jgi:hypothetical protein